MCHSAMTCEKFYQHRDNESTVTTKKVIEKLTFGRHFMPEETKAILKEYPLTEDTTPSLALCQKFKLNKRKKQVQG